MAIFAKRIKDARLKAGLSQEQLGINIGLDPASASTRMNRYELGKRVPDFDLVSRLAEILNLPAAYFYAVTDEEAELLAGFHRLQPDRRREILELVKQ